MHNHRTKGEHDVCFGVYESVRDADRGVHALRGVGFTREEITLIAPEPLRESFEEMRPEEPPGEQEAEGAGIGGAIGAVLGGVGAAALATATGGLGLIVLGPLLGGAAAGAVVGGFVGAMGARGLEPEVADLYDQALQAGKILVAVESSEEERLRTAERVFRTTGAAPVEQVDA